MMTVNEAAAKAGISNTRIRQLIREGRLAATPPAKKGLAYTITAEALAQCMQREDRRKTRHSKRNDALEARAFSNDRERRAAAKKAKQQEVITPPHVKPVQIPSSFKPRFQAVELPTMRGSLATRASGEEFRQYQKKGRF